MAFKRVIHHDPVTNYIQWYHEDDEGNIYLESAQDVESIIENNKTQFNQTDKHTRWGEGQKVASIPLSIFYSPEFQAIRKDERKLAQWLNSPDNRAFRTREGTV